MDVIGKMIYNNRDDGQVTVQRQSSSGNENNLGILQMDSTTLISSNTPNLTDTDNTAQNSFANFNQQTLNNILFTAAYLVNANNTKGNNVTATVEIRVYFDDQTPVSNNLISFANGAVQILTGQANFSGTSGVSGTQFKNQPFPQDSVGVVKINLDDVNDRRSPSQSAIDAARNQIANNTITISLPAGSSDTTTPPPANDKLRAALFGYIVDCWMTFTTNPVSGT